MVFYKRPWKNLTTPLVFERGLFKWLLGRILGPGGQENKGTREVKPPMWLQHAGEGLVGGVFYILVQDSWAKLRGGAPCERTGAHQYIWG